MQLRTQRPAPRFRPSANEMPLRRPSAKMAGMKLLIVTHHRLDLWIAPPWFVDRLRIEFPQSEVVRLTSYDNVEKELPETEVAFSYSIRPEQLQFANKLRWVHSPAAAIHQFLYPAFVSSDILLTNAREVHGPVVAEHVLRLSSLSPNGFLNMFAIKSSACGGRKNYGSKADARAKSRDRLSAWLAWVALAAMSRSTRPPWV